MIEPKEPNLTAKICTYMYCGTCGWPAVFCCVNDGFLWFGDACHFDYWVYCANKGCENHAGTGMDQYIPAWAVEILGPK